MLEFDEVLIEEFAKDFFLALNAVKSIDTEYAAAKKEFIHDFAHLRQLIKDWNKKYPNILLRVHEDGIQLKLKVVLRDILENVVFAATKIEGLESINGKDVDLEGINLKEFKASQSGYRICVRHNSQNWLTWSACTSCDMGKARPIATACWLTPIPR